MVVQYGKFTDGVERFEGGWKVLDGMRCGWPSTVTCWS